MGASQVLIPPGVAGADVTQRTFNASVAAGHGQCPPSITTNGKRIRVTLTRAFLSQQPIGWLNEWTADLESQGCIAPGTSQKLAEQIAQALPLDIDRAFHLLHSNQIDITSQMRIQVLSPILREGLAPDRPIPEPAETSGKGNSITVNIKSSANLLGYETAMYAVEARPVESDSASFLFTPIVTSATTPNAAPNLPPTIFNFRRRPHSTGSSMKRSRPNTPRSSLPPAPAQSWSGAPKYSRQERRPATS